MAKSGSVAVYLFFENLYSEFDYSILKIDVEEYSKGKEMLEVKQAIFEFPRDEYPFSKPAAAPPYGSTISFVDPHDTLHLALAFDCTSMLQHLGDACFLFVSSAQAHINYDFGREDPYAHNVFITIFKDVEADADVSSFKSKIIFSQDYVSKTDSDCFRKLLGCFHVSTPLPTIKEQTKKEET